MTERKYDEIEIFQGGHVIQHGPANDRVYLMKMAGGADAALPGALIALGRRHGYGKIFAKVPAAAAGDFRQAGYESEATVPGYYGGSGQADLLCYYLQPARRQEREAEQLDAVLRQAEAVSVSVAGIGFRRRQAVAGVTVRSCAPADAEAMAALYRAVFASYPFPVDDPGYLRQTLRDHVHYVGAERGGRLIALASAECDMAAGSAEMTDFATMPECRGLGLGGLLLEASEQAMQAAGIRTAYTIARAVSVPINVLFSRAGYRYTGRLRNNTQISGCLESMNVWYKPLAACSLRSECPPAG